MLLGLRAEGWSEVVLATKVRLMKTTTAWKKFFKFLCSLTSKMASLNTCYLFSLGMVDSKRLCGKFSEKDARWQFPE